MNTLKAIIAAVALLMTVATPTSAHDVDLEGPAGKLSYTLGIQFAIQINQQLNEFGVPLDGEVLGQAIADALTAGEIRMSEEEMQATMREFAEQQTKLQQEMVEMVTKSGDEFRAEFAKKEGVQSTDSGLLYRVVEKGDGAMPGTDSTVTVHYRGTLTDGSEFDSSYSRDEPTTFSLGAIIPGWVEALQLMNVGSKFEVVMPPELAYGERGSPPVIPPMATLVFEIELLDVE